MLCNKKLDTDIGFTIWDQPLQHCANLFLPGITLTGTFSRGFLFTFGFLLRLFRITSFINCFGFNFVFLWVSSCFLVCRHCFGLRYIISHLPFCVANRMSIGGNGNHRLVVINIIRSCVFRILWLENCPQFLGNAEVGEIYFVCKEIYSVNMLPYDKNALNTSGTFHVMWFGHTRRMCIS